MSANKIDLDAWLEKNVNWMIQETSHYFETRELLALCQTVATMQLARALAAQAGGAQAILEMGQQQNELLGQLLAGKAPKAGKAKPGAKG